MLQIGSGKLFEREAGRRNALRGVIYSNLRIYRDKAIETAAGRILPLEVSGPPNAFAFEFDELIEGEAEGPGVLVSRTAAPYLSEFAVVAAFALNVTCSPDSKLVERLTGGQRGRGVIDPPASYMSRVFEADVWLQDQEIEPFQTFVRELLALERRSYRAAVRAMSTFVTGLHRMGDDLELAYTLLVASIESLAQGFDGHRAEWRDYDQAKRERIDKALGSAPDDIADGVRDALLEIEHVSLRRRFRDFTLDHIGPAFFRDEAAGVTGPVGRGMLPAVLSQAYQLRSRYIHSLAELPRVLTMGAMPGEVSRIDRTAFLTFRGLARVARHVIFEFVRRGAKVEKEAYDYRLEQPGIVSLSMAPQYWVGRADGVQPDHGRRRLEGTLEQLAACMRQEPDAALTDLREVLSAIEPMFPQMRLEDRRPFVALHLIFNGCVAEADRMASTAAVNEKYAREFSTPGAEALILNLLFDQTRDWSLDDHREAVAAYERKRSHKGGLQVPALFEAGLVLALAERYRIAGDIEEARRLIVRAVEDHPGLAGLAALEATFTGDMSLDWRVVLLPRRPMEAAEAAEMP